MADKPKKLAIQDIQATVAKGEPVFKITAVDYPTALAVDRAGIEFILVGDSLGMTALGLDGTVSVTMDMMIHHAKAVSRAANRAIVIGDLPFGAYHASTAQAVDNAVRLMKEGACDVVKLEGGEDFTDKIQAIVRAGIPVMGHIGLTPQTVSKLGGFKVQGKDVATSLQLIRDAKALEKAGACAMVLEAIPDRIAKLITETVSIPTMGIGAGPDCDGQVLVLADMIGMFDRFTPRFVKQYCKVGEQITNAMTSFMEDVRTSQFPLAEHCFTIKDEQYEAVLEALKKT